MPLALLTRYTVGLICKAFLNIGFGTMTVNGLPIFLDALRSARRHNGQGILTGELNERLFECRIDLCFSFQPYFRVASFAHLSSNSS